MSKEIIERTYSKIQNFIASAEFKKIEKDNPTVAAQYKALKAEDLSISLDEGICPKFAYGQAVANVTAEGSKRIGYSDTYQTQTINFDFTDNVEVYVAPENKADSATLQYAMLHSGNPSVEFIGSPSARKKVEKKGKQLCENELSKLNFKLNDYRMNSCDVQISSTFSYKAYPVTANFKDKKGITHKTVVGIYDCEGDNDEIAVENFLKGQAINTATSKSEKGKRIAIGVTVAIVIAGIIAFVVYQFVK